MTKNTSSQIFQLIQNNLADNVPNDPNGGGIEINKVFKHVEEIQLVVDLNQTMKLGEIYRFVKKHRQKLHINLPELNRSMKNIKKKQTKGFISSAIDYNEQNLPDNDLQAS